MSEEYINDELQQMEERERAHAQTLTESISLNDPISVLELQETVVISGDTAVKEAIDLMKAKRVGCLLVEENGRLSGIFTERDVVRKIVGHGWDHAKLKVKDFMTSDPDVLHFDDPIVFALNRMSVGGYRHVPIVGDNHEPLAFVSVRDIVNYIADFYHDAIMNLPPEPVRGAQKAPEGG